MPSWPRVVAERCDATERVHVEVDVEPADAIVVLRTNVRDRSSSSAERQLLFAGTRLMFDGDVVLDQHTFLQAAAARQVAAALVAAADELDAAAAAEVVQP